MNIVSAVENTEYQVLLPSANPLDKGEHMRLKGGLTLWIISMSIPFLLLIEFRYVLSGTYVDPTANQWLAISALVAMLITGLFAQMGSGAAKAGNRKGVLTHYGWAILFAFIAWILLGYQVVDGSMSIVSHYAEVFLPTQGMVDLFVTFALFGMISTRMRVKRLGDNVGNYWGVTSNTAFWWFVVIVWILLWINLYYI